MEKINRDRDPNLFTRSDYPIARVAYEVYELRATLAAVFGNKMPHKEIAEFLPKFEVKKEITELSEEEREKIQKDRILRSKQKYLALAGIGKDGKPIDRRSPSQKRRDEMQSEREKKKKETSVQQGIPAVRNALLNQIKPTTQVLKGNKGKKGKK